MSVEEAQKAVAVAERALLAASLRLTKARWALEVAELKDRAARKAP
jgi:hypothetical protein